MDIKRRSFLHGITALIATTALPLPAFANTTTEDIVGYIKRNLTFHMNSYLFEYNDEKLRTQVYHHVDKMMSSLKNDKRLYDYKIVVDETNNVNLDELAVDLYIKPTRALSLVHLKAKTSL